MNYKTDNNGVRSVLVCGGGHQGLSMAAHLALNGISVALWNRTPENIQEITDTGKIYCTGIVQGTAEIKRATSNLEEVITDFVMVTTPSNAHKDIAKSLAPYVHKDMVIILNPGRTFGAVEFAETLTECGVNELPHIAETQTIIYTCRRGEKNNAKILMLKNDVKIAGIRCSDINYIMKKMPDCLKPYFSAAESTLITSLANVGMILHCAPVMMNIGWIESKKVDFKYYYDGISESVAAFLEKMDAERLDVAAKAGCPTESVADWLRRIYGTTGSNLYECLRDNESYREIDAPPTLNCRYIFEDVPNGLVPIETIGRELGINTPCITLIINLASAVMNQDFRTSGRRFSLEMVKKYI